MAGRVARGTLIAAVLLLAPWTGAANAARLIDPFTLGDPEFCSPEEPVRDFGLSKLPPVREMPVSEGMFGHGAVNAYGGGMFGRILTGPQGYGYGFSESNYTGTVRLNWTVTAQMWSVGGKGNPIEQVGEARLFIGRLNAAHQPHISIDTPSENGFYRFDIQFTAESGALLGSYSEYLKVVPPYWKVRLGLSGSTFKPGERVLSRVENLGTETVSYGESFSVQRLEGGQWMRAPELTRGPWLMWLGIAGAGRSGRCSSLYLPEDVAPGQYRISKSVGEHGWPRGKSRRLTAPFEVVR